MTLSEKKLTMELRALLNIAFEIKSRAVARKPREAVQISICKASGEHHTEDIAIDSENSHFR